MPNAAVSLQDLEGLCDLTAFDLPEETQGSEVLRFRLEECTVQELSQGNRGQLIPISPGAATPPSILTRRSRRRIALSPDANDSMTPKGTPVKNLPFSPSQVPWRTKTTRTFSRFSAWTLPNLSLTSYRSCSMHYLYCGDELLSTWF